MGPQAISASFSWRRMCLFITVAWVAASPLLAHGPMPPQEIEWAPGQVLIRVAPEVDLSRAKARAGSLTSKLAELNERFNIHSAEVVLPQHRPAAIRALARSGRAAAIPKRDLELSERLGRWVLLEGDPHVDVEAMVEAYAELDEVEVAEPNYVMRLVEGEADSTAEVVPATGGSVPVPKFTPNDPDVGLQWGLSYIQAPDAWDITMGDPSQVIAIIDTGVDLDHPDLVSKIWENDDPVGDSNGDTCPGICGVDDDLDGLIDEDGDGVQKGEPGWDSSFAADDDENGYIDDYQGWDWISLGEGYEDNEPQDDNGHGTHCAGIAAAATDNGIGGAGACPLCTIMPLKAFQSSGAGAFSDIAKAVEYARREGATVISMSFGSYADSSLVYDALSLAWSTSVLVAAAGNDNKNRIWFPFYPAHYSFVLGVEAGDSGGAKAGFSNFSYELRNPGAGIYSTVLDDSYATWSGTSMAAPFVAGTAGLLRTDQPTWGPDLLFGQLIRSGGDAQQALTLVPEPDLRFIDFEVVDDVGSCPTCDGDGVPDSGETVDVVVTVRNMWGNATGVTGTLTTADPLATMVDDTADWGAIGPAAFDDNGDNPFRVAISASAGNNRDIVFDLAVSAANGGAGISQQYVLTVQRGVERSGLIVSSETWTSDNLYLVDGNLLVTSGATLTIEPGTRIQVDPGTSIVVNGALIARGTPDDRIEIVGNRGPWGMLHFDYSVSATFDGDGNYLSGTVLEYCTLEDMGTETYGVYVATASPYIARNIFRNVSANQGIMLAGLGSAPFEENLLTDFSNSSWSAMFAHPGMTVRHNTISGNATIGLIVGGGSSEPWNESNNLFGNQPYNFKKYIGSGSLNLTGVYWGTTDSDEIDEGIYDFFDDPSLTVVVWDPPLELPDPIAPPVVANIEINPPSPVAAETITVEVTFSKPMNTALNPGVFFGPANPFTSHPIDQNTGWTSATSWQGQSEVTIYTGDGQQVISVWNAEDVSGFPIPHGDHRFGFEIVTSGTSAAQLQALGDLGHIDLSWFPSDLSDLAGYNLYRSEVTGGPYAPVNSAIITDTAFADYAVDPAITYHYIYRVMNTDLEEGPDSDEASAQAIDAVAPEIEHTPITSWSTGVPISIPAIITDNVTTPTAMLHYRPHGGAWTALVMINATGDQFVATIPGADVFCPGVFYYIEATDGFNTAYHGTETAPHIVEVGIYPCVLFADGFESGDTSAWSGVTGLGP